jgi:hypothetical protein
MTTIMDHWEDDNSDYSPISDDESEIEEYEFTDAADIELEEMYEMDEKESEWVDILKMRGPTKEERVFMQRADFRDNACI